MKLELNDQEAQALVNMLDMAVKAQGLNVAATALFLAEKINKARTERPLEVVKNEETGTA